MSLSTETLWHALGTSLRGFIQGRVGDPDAAEDVLQDVFVKIHGNIHTLQDEDRVTAWVYRITRNAIVDRVRREPPAPKPLPDLPEPQEESQDTFRQELSRSVQALIKTLPERYRSVMELVELRGLTQKDAAEQLGLSLSATKSRVQRGRARIRAALLECCHLEFDRRGRPIHWEPRRECGRCC